MNTLHHAAPDIEEICQLWDQLSDFGSHQLDEALHHCLRTLCRWLEADHAFWVGAVRMLKREEARNDRMYGWRIGKIDALKPAHIDPAHLQLALSRKHPEESGATNIALAAGAGRFRSYRLHAGLLVDVDEFMKSDHFDFYYRLPGISDRIWVAFPVGDDVESFFCFDKFGERRFSDTDLDVATAALRGIKWFHRQLLLSHGLGICTNPLTEAERRVKQVLLSGATEKEIAHDLNLSPGTVHQYARRIYRKFGVKGRADFMALWLSGCS